MRASIVVRLERMVEGVALFQVPYVISFEWGHLSIPQWLSIFKSFRGILADGYRLARASSA